jgi:Polyketide cyclase / dehydrase and lipid transport
VIGFQTSVCIERPIDEVFSHVSEVANFPLWNSAVQDIRRRSAPKGQNLGSTYSMLRSLPGLGKVENELKVVEHERPSSFAIKTTSGPTPFFYRFQLSPQDGATVVRLKGRSSLGGPPTCLGRSCVTPCKEQWTTTSRR